MSGRLMSVTAVAEQLDCSRGHVYDLIATGAFSTVNIGAATRSKTRIPASEVDAFIAVRSSAVVRSTGPSRIDRGGDAGLSG